MVQNKRISLETINEIEKKLKKCPFCGYDPVLETYEVRKGYEATISCNDCNASIPTITYNSEEDAIHDVVKKWNNRI